MPTFQNETDRPAIEGKITEGVRISLLRQLGTRLTRSPNDTDSLLRGRITKYATTPLSFDSEGRVETYRLTLSLSYRLERPGKTGHGQVATGFSDYTVFRNTEKTAMAEQSALTEAATRIAEQIGMRLWGATP